MTNKKHSFEWWVANCNTPEGKAEFARMKRLYAEDMAVKEGPVRTVTRREIVPGVYGKLTIHACGDYSIDVCTADELTDAIETLTKIKDAL